MEWILKSKFTLFFCFQILINNALSWNTDELEVFDAVDEIKQNFYEMMNVTRDADLAAIKKSFRKLSLALHPDKNPSPTAEQDFRNVVTVYEILKSSEKRQYYDKFLKHGLPDWRQAVYYYRRVRKMGLLELFVILTVFISIGQYLIAWASYIEQKYTLKEILKSKDKKTRKLKKYKNDVSFSDEYIESTIKKPSLLNILPLQICYVTKALVIFLFKLSFVAFNNWRKESVSKPSKEQLRPRNEFVQKPARERTKKVNYTPELVDYEPEIVKNVFIQQESKPPEITPVISGGLWTDDDILDLIKLTKKYQPGEVERWSKIAEAMNRTVAEVTHMANKIKENDFRLPTEEEEEPIPEPESKKTKTRGGKLGDKVTEEEKDISTWTQTQQKAFEAALNKYSKKSVDDRWEKISNCVPGKTKEDCILRYKKIAAMVKQKKSTEESQEPDDS